MLKRLRFGRFSRDVPLTATIFFKANIPEFVQSLDVRTRRRLINSEKRCPPEKCCCCVFFKVGFDEDQYRDEEYDTCALGVKPIFLGRPDDCPLIAKGDKT